MVNCVVSAADRSGKPCGYNFSIRECSAFTSARHCDFFLLRLSVSAAFCFHAWLLLFLFGSSTVNRAARLCERFRRSAACQQRTWGIGNEVCHLASPSAPGVSGNVTFC
jgi:hypothetical protein